MDVVGERNLIKSTHAAVIHCVHFSCSFAFSFHCANARRHDYCGVCWKSIFYWAFWRRWLKKFRNRHFWVLFKSKIKIHVPLPYVLDITSQGRIQDFFSWLIFLDIFLNDDRIGFQKITGFYSQKPLDTPLSQVNGSPKTSLTP